MRNKIVKILLLCVFTAVLFANSVYTPMTEDLNVNGFDIIGAGGFDAYSVITDDLVAKYPRVDVRYFGAKGDGVTDDTNSIQDAVDYAYSLRASFKPSASSPYVCYAPSVYFPKGKYLITSTIANVIGLIGDGAVVVMGGQNADTTDMFDIYAYSNKIEGLKFVGGRTQLKVYNENLNATMIQIERCEFHLSKSYSVRLIPSGSADHLSCIATIKDCKFYLNYQVLENYADSCNFIDCWVEPETPTMKDGAVFVNQRGHLFFRDMLGVPVAGTGENRLVNARWVDNYASFSAMYSRFGGEDAGMPIVYNYAEPDTSYPYMGGGKIVITDCVLLAGGTNTNASVIKMYEIPQLVVLRDNYYLAESPYIIIDSNLNLDTYFDSIPSVHAKFIYTIEPNLKWNAGAVPEQLMAFVNPFREAYLDKPSSGYWQQGHVLFNSDVTHNSHLGIVNTTSGEPGVWSYFGKTSPFPIGPKAGTVISGNKGKYTFDLPDSTNFTALITTSSNPNSGGSDVYRTSLTIMLSIETGWNGSAVTDYIKYQSIFAPTIAYPSAPVIDSIHFGSGDTGSDTRAHTNGGQMTIVWNNCSAYPEVSIEPLSVR
ncbi:MAG: glycosyl hydrolase family 28-related protein [Sedimentisphaerales bacterium]